jgi:hypothetical protein
MELLALVCLMALVHILMGMLLKAGSRIIWLFYRGRLVSGFFMGSPVHSQQIILGTQKANAF